MHKKDKYENDISYVANETIDLDTIVKDIPKNLKMPYWVGKESDYILKVRARHWEKEQQTKGVANISLKKYDYEQFTGYFVTKVAFE